mmetsp:Transcript_10172/g.28758  ORF Transcript_10172/g.28758 Transcript_10172/m.28758 type:complete len:504 (-) Transcript_10172:27-1538(-)
MEGALRLVQNVSASTSQNNCTGLPQGNSREAYELVLPNHDFLDELALSNLRVLGVVEGRHDLTAGDKSEPLDSVEVGVLDGHHSGVREELLREVVDQLPVDEAVDSVVNNLLDLLPHLVLLGLLYRPNLCHSLGLHASPVDFDLVRVHRGVRDENLRVLDPLWLTDANLFVQNKSFVKVRLVEGSPGLLDHLDGVQVRGPLEPKDSIDRQLGEVLLVVRQDLGRQRRSRDLKHVLLVLLRVFDVVHGKVLQGLQRAVHGLPVPLDDRLGVEPHVHELLGLPQKLPGEHDHGGRSVAHLVVLDLGDVHQNLGGRVVHVDRLQDGRSIVRDRHLLAPALRLKDLVHALGTQSRLDEICYRHGTYEGRQASHLALLLRRLLIQQVVGCAVLHRAWFSARLTGQQNRRKEKTKRQIRPPPSSEKKRKQKTKSRHKHDAQTNPRRDPRSVQKNDDEQRRGRERERGRGRGRGGRDGVHVLVRPGLSFRCSPRCCPFLSSPLDRRRSPS